MKKTFHLMALLAFVAVFGLSSCEKETPQPTLNPVGYTITSLKLTNIPMVDGNNASWDAGILENGAPDIYFEIMDKDKTTTYFTSTYYEDVTSFPVSWSNVNRTLQVGTQYIIRFYDYDGLSVNDVMADCVLQINASSAPRTTYEWTAANGKIGFTLGLKWLYSN